MSLKLPLTFVLVAFVLNGIACACPTTLDAADSSAPVVDVAHHHATQEPHSCEHGCDCAAVSATKAERNPVARIDRRIVEGDGDIVVTCPAPAAISVFKQAAGPPPALAARSNQAQRTPVSRYERMLD